MGSNPMQRVENLLSQAAFFAPDSSAYLRAHGLRTGKEKGAANPGYSRVYFVKKKEVKGPAGVVLGRKEVWVLYYYTHQKENLGMDKGFKSSDLEQGRVTRFTLSLHYGNLK